MPPEQYGYATQGNIREATGQPEPMPRPYHGEEAIAPREDVIRPICIRQLSHGYFVEIGCQTFAIESASALIAKFSEYILNPLATEAKHKEGKLF